MSTSARPNVDQGFLRRLAVTTAQSAVDRTPIPSLRPATVVSSTDGITSVILDGDDAPVLAEALVPEPEPDDRVMVLLQPPSGAFVVGYVGTSRDRWGAGGGGATEVTVDPAQPTDRAELLLWVDTDATLPVPVSSGWQALTLTSPWTPYGGGGWAPPAIRRIGDIVELRGLLSNNGALPPSTIANVPAPAANLIFLGAGDSTSATAGTTWAVDIRIYTDGRMQIQSPIQSFLSLAQVRYSVAA